MRTRATHQALVIRPSSWRPLTFVCRLPSTCQPLAQPLVIRRSLSYLFRQALSLVKLKPLLFTDSPSPCRSFAKPSCHLASTCQALPPFHSAPWLSILLSVRPLSTSTSPCPLGQALVHLNKPLSTRTSPCPSRQALVHLDKPLSISPSPC